MVTTRSGKGVMNNPSSNSDSNSEQQTAEKFNNTDDVISATHTTLFAANVITGANMSAMLMYLTSMPFLFPEKGMPIQYLGYFQSSVAFLQLCWAPVCGRLTDLFGPRRVMCLCLFSCFGALVLMGLANSLWMLILSRFVSLLQDVLPVTQMVVTDLVPASERPAALSRTMLPVSVGFVAGPFLGGILTGIFGIQGGLLVGATLPCLCIGLAITHIPNENQAQKHIGEEPKAADDIGMFAKMKNLSVKANVIPLLVLRFLIMMPFMMLLINSSIVNKTIFGLDSQANMYMISFGGIVNMVNYGFVVGYINRTFHQQHVVTVFSASLAVSFLALMFSSTIQSYTISHMMVSFFAVVLDNIVVVALTKTADAHENNTMVGLLTAVFHLARSVSPAVGGAVISSYGLPAFCSIGLFSTIALISIIVLNRQLLL